MKMMLCAECIRKIRDDGYKVYRGYLTRESAKENIPCEFCETRSDLYQCDVNGKTVRHIWETVA